MEEKKSWHHEIDFRCSFGMWPFRKTLEIAPEGFIWCGERYPLRTITKLRWGVDLRRGGVFPKRVYRTLFGTSDKEFTIKTKQKDFYEHLTDRIWKAVGKRLLAEMLDGLGRGEKFAFGDFIVEDEGITVTKKGAFTSAVQSYYSWDKLRWGIVNGSLCFAELGESGKTLVGCSFLWIDNAHVLNVALGLLQNSKQKKKLSSCKI